MAKRDAYESGMRGKEKPKKSKVRGVSIDKADNGHIVRVNHEYTGADFPGDMPKEKLFEDGSEDELVKHVLSSLGIKHNEKDNGNGEDCNGKCPSCCE